MIDSRPRARNLAQVTSRVIVFVSLLGTIASAKEPATAIAPLITGRSCPVELQRAFAEELPKALDEAGFVLMPPNEVDLKIGERPELLQCHAGACLAEVATYLRVRRLAIGRLERAEGGVAVGIGVYDAGQKQVISDALGRAANVAELHTAVRALARKLRLALTRPGRLEVNGAPGSAVTVDGEHKGAAPWAGALDPGDHVVGLETNGTRVERDVTVAPAQTARVDIGQAAPPLPREEKRWWLTPAKWTALAGGVAALAAGAALVAIDGRGSCSLGGGQRQCPELYDTKYAGIGTLAGGGVLLVGATLAFVFDRKGR